MVHCLGRIKWRLGVRGEGGGPLGCFCNKLSEKLRLRRSGGFHSPGLWPLVLPRVSSHTRETWKDQQSACL